VDWPWGSPRLERGRFHSGWTRQGGTHRGSRQAAAALDLRPPLALQIAQARGAPVEPLWGRGCGPPSPHPHGGASGHAHSPRVGCSQLSVVVNERERGALGSGNYRGGGLGLLLVRRLGSIGRTSSRTTRFPRRPPLENLANNLGAAVATKAGGYF
jgi:hypothetical protein